VVAKVEKRFEKRFEKDDLFLLFVGSLIKKP
jgi:hypothetical protein